MKLNKSIQHFTFIILLITTATFYACKKEHVSNVSIVILQPIGGAEIVAGDTFAISARIKSVEVIEQIEVTVKSLSGIPVSNSLLLSPNSKFYSLDIQYALEADINLSGTYLLDIIVNDGFSNSHESVPIHITAIDLKTKNIYVITSKASSTVIFKIDSANTYSFLTVVGDYSGASIDSRNHILFTCGQRTGAINFINLTSAQIEYSIPPFTSLGDNYSGCGFYDQELFVSRSDGAIRSYNHNGLMNYNTGENPYKSPGQPLKINDKVMAGLTENTSGATKIGVFYYPSGMGMQESLLYGSPVKMIPISSDSILLIRQKNNDCYLDIYSIRLNFSGNLLQLNNTFGYDLMKTHNGLILIATDHGTYSSGINTLTFSIASTIPSYSFGEDEITGELFISEGTTLKRTNEALNNLHSYFFQDSIVAILPEYTR